MHDTASVVKVTCIWVGRNVARWRAAGQERRKDVEVNISLWLFQKAINVECMYLIVGEHLLGSNLILRHISRIWPGLQPLFVYPCERRQVSVRVLHKFFICSMYTQFLSVNSVELNYRAFRGCISLEIFSIESLFQCNVCRIVLSSMTVERAGILHRAIHDIQIPD